MLFLFPTNDPSAMKGYAKFLCILFVLGFIGFHTASAIDPSDTRLLSKPAISNDHIAFIYAEDLWVAEKDGSHPRRMTIAEVQKSSPMFSPDGETIAFNPSYDGITDAHIRPSAG